jgi:hypothetical protein
MSAHAHHTPVPAQRRELRDPKTLRVHKLISTQPELTDDDPEFLRIVASIQEHGYDADQPIKITEAGDIADGRHRWRAVKRLKLPEIPCVIVDDSEVAGIALLTLVARRHYTPSQLAFASYPLLKPAFEEAEKRRIANLKSASASPETQSLRFGEKKGSDLAVKTVENYAAELAISLRLLQQAAEVHQLFTDPKKRTISDRDGVTEDDVTFREFFQPRLMRSEEPYGLGAVLTATKQIHDLERKAGVGKAHTGGKPKQVEKRLGLFDEVVKDGIKRFTYWQGFDAETRNQHWEHVRQQAAKLKQGECEELADYYARLAKEYAKAAKEAANAE